jgi:hypothetical protein
MDRYAQQQAERIDEDMALATRDLLARIEAFSSNPRTSPEVICHVINLTDLTTDLTVAGIPPYKRAVSRKWLSAGPDRYRSWATRA